MSGFTHTPRGLMTMRRSMALPRDVVAAGCMPMGPESRRIVGRRIADLKPQERCWFMSGVERGELASGVWDPATRRLVVGGLDVTVPGTSTLEEVVLAVGSMLRQLAGNGD